jgi:mRNA interferase MazF
VVTRTPAKAPAAPKPPDQGDIVYLDFEPQAGREQAKRRPALVLSPRIYNDAAGLMLCCPISSQVKGYPFEVAVVGSGGIAGVVLADQLRSLDWHARNATHVGRAAKETLDEVVAKIRPLLPK